MKVSCILSLIIFSFSLSSQELVDFELRYANVFNYLKNHSTEINVFFERTGEPVFKATPEYFIFGDTQIVKSVLSSLGISKQELAVEIVELEDSIVAENNCDSLSEVYSSLFMEKIPKLRSKNWIKYLQKKDIKVIHYSKSDCYPYLSPSGLVLLDEKIKLGKFSAKKENAYYVMLSKKISDISCALIVPVDHEKSCFGVTGYLLMPPSPLLFIFVHEDGVIIKGAFYNKKLKYGGWKDCPKYE